MLTVVSRAVRQRRGANRWESDGADGYTVTPCEKADNGTKIVLHHQGQHRRAKTTTNFLNLTASQGLVKKYSDYIRYPIKMDMTRFSHEGEAGRCRR